MKTTHSNGQVPPTILVLLIHERRRLEIASARFRCHEILRVYHGVKQSVPLDLKSHVWFRCGFNQESALRAQTLIQRIELDMDDTNYETLQDPLRTVTKRL